MEGLKINNIEIRKNIVKVNINCKDINEMKSILDLELKGLKYEFISYIVENIKVFKLILIISKDDHIILKRFLDKSKIEYSEIINLKLINILGISINTKEFHLEIQKELLKYNFGIDYMAVEGMKISYVFEDKYSQVLENLLEKRIAS